MQVLQDTTRAQLCCRWIVSSKFLFRALLSFSEHRIESKAVLHYVVFQIRGQVSKIRTRAIMKESAEVCGRACTAAGGGQVQRSLESRDYFCLRALK